MRIDRFVGLPYVPHGRDYQGADCWGLVYLFYRDALGLSVPAYELEMSERRFERKEIGRLILRERAADWSAVECPEPGDCVLMRNGHAESHVGIFVGNDQILHSEGDAGSVLEKASGKRLRHRIIGYYRLKRAG